MKFPPWRGYGYFLGLRNVVVADYIPNVVYIPNYTLQLRTQLYTQRGCGQLYTHLSHFWARPECIGSPLLNSITASLNTLKTF